MTAQTRPGGRTEHVRKAVADAVLHSIETVGLNFTIQDVVRLSGVHRTTIYRRWPSREELLAEALREHTSRIHLETTGDWRTDLLHMAHAFLVFSSSPVERAMNSLLALSENSKFRAQMLAHWWPILKKLEAPIREGQRRGEISPAVEPSMLVTMLTSSIVAHLALTELQVSSDFVDSLVKHILMIATGSGDGLNASNKTGGM